MKVYNSELGEHPFPRSLKNIKALATIRGATVGVEYAEAFQLIKYIDKFVLKEKINLTSTMLYFSDIWQVK